MEIYLSGAVKVHRSDRSLAPPDFMLLFERFRIVNHDFAVGRPVGEGQFIARVGGEFNRGDVLVPVLEGQRDQQGRRVDDQNRAVCAANGEDFPLGVHGNRPGVVIEPFPVQHLVLFGVPLRQQLVLSDGEKGLVLWVDGEAPQLPVEMRADYDPGFPALLRLARRGKFENFPGSEA